MSNFFHCVEWFVHMMSVHSWPNFRIQKVSQLFLIPLTPPLSNVCSLSVHTRSIPKKPKKKGLNDGMVYFEKQHHIWSQCMFIEYFQYYVLQIKWIVEFFPLCFANWMVGASDVCSLSNLIFCFANWMVGTYDVHWIWFFDSTIM